ALQRDVPRGQFEDDDLELGMLIRADKGGGPIVGTIVEIADEVVTIDGNHPLAGVNLNFEVTIREVREATAEELEHGHAHGPGGHLH
ncbi:MAG: peptidylprolyl isomerase, partial [Pirellulales bacterium]